jgi:signal transduction histidine kinase
MRSLRSRLLLLWLMLVASGTVTGVLLLELYRQSANAQVGRAEEAVARACRDLGDRYQFFASGWPGGSIDDALKQELTAVVQAALAHAPGIEGGIWQAENGSLAYAFPTYEGTGPKTDLPVAELATIRQINADALRGERPVTLRQPARSQVLLIHACPLKGPRPQLTGWTMTRVFTTAGRSYNQLLVGLAVLGVTIVGSALWLAGILYSWSRQLMRLQTALAARPAGAIDLPALAPTGERELDRLVDALNAAGTRLAHERQRAGAAERLAAIGRLAAGLAHEIRNPIAAMRLKAENALAAGHEDRRLSALQSVLEQIGRLDALLRDLLAMSQRHEPNLADVDLATFLERATAPHRELAASKGVRVHLGSVDRGSPPPQFDAEQMHRALDNLILNAIQNTAPEGSVTVEAAHHADRLILRVRDTGKGIPEAIRDRLFEPFVTGRPDGTGLGLAAVREIARAHGGEARLAATGDGTTFEIEAPWRTS